MEPAPLTPREPDTQVVGTPSNTSEAPGVASASQTAPEPGGDGILDPTAVAEVGAAEVGTHHRATPPAAVSPPPKRRRCGGGEDGPAESQGSNVVLDADAPGVERLDGPPADDRSDPPRVESAVHAGVGDAVARRVLSEEATRRRAALADAYAREMHGDEASLHGVTGLRRVLPPGVQRRSGDDGSAKRRRL